MRSSTVTCFRCRRKITAKERLVFIAFNAVHLGKCPKRKKEKLRD